MNTTQSTARPTGVTAIAALSDIAPRPPIRGNDVVDCEDAREMFAQLAQADVCHHDSYRPLLLRLHTRDVGHGLRAALADHAAVDVHDRITLQLRELVLQRAPGRALTSTQVDAAIAAITDGSGCYGLWIYYPWSRRLVHVLEEAHFIEVRTNRNLYKITPAERDRLASKRVGVIGLSVGQSIALTLAMERAFGEIRLADFDCLELSNLNRLRSGLHNLGVPKVRIAAREIAEIDPYLRVVCHERGIDASNIDAFLTSEAPIDALVEECDSIDIKFLARERARHHRIPVLMDTSDRGMFDLERFDLEPQRPIFHGLAGDIDHRTLAGLTYEQKIPHMLTLMGVQRISPRLRASMLEIDQTLTSWPQLASAVTLGGAVGADVCRRVLLGEAIASGRHYIDIEAQIPAQPTTQATSLRVQRGAQEGDWPTPDALRAALDDPGLTPDTLDRACVEHLVHAGNAAPSGGNLQPWRWRYTGGVLYLLRDNGRASPWLSVHGLADHLALGAAAENVVLAAHAAGLHLRLQPAHTAANAPFACAFSLYRTPPRALPLEPHTHDGLAAQIERRCTNREIRPRQALPPATRDALLASARSLPGIDLHLLSDTPQLDLARDIICEATRCQFLNRRFHRGMMEEIRWDAQAAEDSRDGIDLPGLSLSAVDRAGLEICRDWQVIEHLKHWRLGRGLARLPRRAIDGACAVGLLTAANWTQAGFFAAGRAMQRLWLTATSLDIGLQPWSVLPYLYARQFLLAGEGLESDQNEILAALWTPYRELFGLDEQRGQALLFRLCAPPESVTHSMRRPVAAVLRYGA